MNTCIQAFENRDGGQIDITAKECGDIIELDAWDDGCGIRADIRDKVFDPLVTIKRNQGGTGLGMNIGHNHITEKLRGSIELIQPADGGTQWHIVLPKHLEESRLKKTK